VAKVEVIVKVEKDYKDKLAEIAAECKAAGMSVEQQMNALGMISGSVERASIKRLEGIKGVSYVEESKSISL
jgi:hypothetical protein